jgi:hypothetical protein
VGLERVRRATCLREADGEALRAVAGGHVVVSVGEPAVVAFLPGWSEKKVLARFLKLG